MTESPADKVRGWLLYSPKAFNGIENRYFFRVYGEIDPATGRKPFTDYKICAEDIEVTLEGGGIALYEDPENPEKNRVDYNSRILGK